MISINSGPFGAPSMDINIILFEGLLFHRYRFGQITGLIYIATSHYRNMIG
jgi:hypothetical protein